jgi:hypothetical protein
LELRELLSADGLFPAPAAAAADHHDHVAHSAMVSSLAGYVADYLPAEAGSLSAASAEPVRAPAFNRTVTHLINGVQHQFTWDAAPEAAISDPVLAPATMSADLHALNAIPALNSNVSAAASIYLDFNGHFQSSWGAWSNITTPVYDFDGDATTFSDAELATIESVWQRVAEDFLPFNINVTTVEPAVLAAGAPESGANGKALRVAFGGSGSDWYGSSIGGVSYINSFTSTIANVAYVFAGGTSTLSWMSNASSHEAGHAFGLQHQSAYDANGVKTNEYHPGTETWIPIMGTANAVGEKLSTWHNGTNSLGPTSFQDDIATIGRSANVFGYRADDRSNTIGGATPLSGAGTEWSGTGFIGAGGDVDWFSLDLAQAENLRISVSGPVGVRNLDVAIELRDAAGTLIASADPADAFDASIVRNLQGRHYIGVKSNGQYGRLGQYTVSVTESLPDVSISDNRAPFTTSESGRKESVTFVLTSKPAADVTFNVASSDPGEGVVSTSAVVFTPQNWFTPQTVTVTGVADGIADGAAAYTVTFAPAVSADPSYNGFDPADLNIVNLDDAPGQIYWVRSNAVNNIAAIDRSSLAGDPVLTVLDIPSAMGAAPAGFYSSNRLTIDPVAGKMYWTDTINYTISRANLDGSQAQVILTFANAVSDIAIDPVAGKIYWTDGVLDKIRRANLDGSGIVDVIAAGLSQPSGLELDLPAGKMYWSDNTTREILRANLDGSNVEVIRAGDGVNLPQNITLDLQSGKLYYGLRQNFDTQQLYRSNHDGSGEELLDDLDAIDPSIANPVTQGIAIDHASGRILWSESLRQRVYSADLDGGNVAVVFEARANDLRGIALLPATPGFAITPTSGLSTTEAGGMTTFTVALNTPPTASVVIPVATSDTSEGSVNVSSLTFTPANWSTPQTVTITGVDDATYDQDVAYTIVLGAATSADANYNGLNPTDVSVTNRDNDPAPTKFYVVNDATQNRTYEYGPTGALVDSYNLNSGNAAPRGAASSVAGDKTWVVDSNRKVYVYNNSGGLLGSWTAGTLATSATVEVIATNGADVWIVDAKSDKVFRYTAAATRTSGSQNAASSFALNSGNANPKDIVTDGTYLWVVNDSTTDKVFKYTVGGSYLGSWTIDSANKSPTGITLDPASPSHLWIVDSGTDRIYQYNSAVGRTSGSQSAATFFALATGNTNPQGIADPPTPGRVETQNRAFSLVVRDDFAAPPMLNSDRLTKALNGKPVAARPQNRPPIESLSRVATHTPEPIAHNWNETAGSSWRQHCDDAFEDWGDSVFARTTTTARRDGFRLRLRQS